MTHVGINLYRHFSVFMPFSLLGAVEEKYTKVKDKKDFLASSFPNFDFSKSFAFLHFSLIKLLCYCCELKYDTILFHSETYDDIQLHFHFAQPFLSIFISHSIFLANTENNSGREKLIQINISAEKSTTASI